jgi:hypothetical protein
MACSSSNHCYGVVYSAPSAIDGAHVDIDPSCLNDGSASPAFITDEMWLSDYSSSPNYWIETGYLQNDGFNIGGLGSGQYVFWAQKGPNVSFSAHGHQAGTLPVQHFTIYKTATHTYGIGYAGYSATATNSFGPDHAVYGSETTTASSHGRGAWTKVGWRTGTSTWHAGVANPSYRTDSPPQYFSWSTYDTSFKAAPAC